MNIRSKYASDFCHDRKSAFKDVVSNTLARRQTHWVNACQVFDNFEKIQENLRICYLPFITSTDAFDIKPVIVFNDGRELQTEAKEA